MPVDFSFFTDLLVLYLFGTLLLLPMAVPSTLGQWLLTRMLGLDWQQCCRVLCFPLLAPIPILILSSLCTLGLTLPEILDYAVFVAMDYLYCRRFIPRLNKKQLWIFFPATIVLTILAMPVYYLFP